MKAIFFFIAIFFFSNTSLSQPQTNTISVNLVDGIIAMGYVDHGAYLNFTGPNLSFSRGKSKLMLGMLPSLRYKQDTGVTKNSPIIPSLGVGLTYSYKRCVFQLPLYYNAKTSTANGNWQLGIGVGFRFKK
jgi:hypothetical protein